MPVQVQAATDAEIADVAALCQAHQQGWRHRRPFAWTAERVEKVRLETTVLVARLDGSLIGVLILHPRAEVHPEAVSVVGFVLDRRLSRPQADEATLELLRTGLAAYPDASIGGGLVEATNRQLLRVLQENDVTTTVDGVDPISGRPHFYTVTADLSALRARLGQT